MNRSIQQMIPQIQGYLADQPVSKAWLFGSYSRGEETANSDIDLLVEYTDSDSISLFTISRIATPILPVGREINSAMSESPPSQGRREPKVDTRRG